MNEISYGLAIYITIGMFGAWVLGWIERRSDND